MDIKPIHNDEDYEAALSDMRGLWEAEPGTPEHDKLEILGALVSAYEDTRWPIDLPDPIDAIKFRMEQAGYQQKDFAELIGSKSRASEILNRKRGMTVGMIRKIHKAWNIPAEALIGGGL